jgi:hypothetical protein
MMTSTHRVRTVGDVLSLLTGPEFSSFAAYEPSVDLRGPKYFGNFGIWFRGHASEHWELVPSAFRSSEGVDEQAAYWLFRLGAPEYRAQCKTIFDWLCLMRHSGLPTRLLDWSENVLIPLFMACDDKSVHDTDGALWILHTQRMHEVALSFPGWASVRVPHSTDVGLRAQMVTESDRASFEGMARRLDGESAMSGAELDHYLTRFAQGGAAADAAYAELATPLAVYPYRQPGRMAAQQSVVTLHGGKVLFERHVASCDIALPPPTSLHNLEKGVAPERRFLMKIIIAHEGKSSILRELTTMGIEGRTVYPDLDQLARSLRQQFAREHIATRDSTSTSSPHAKT